MRILPLLVWLFCGVACHGLERSFQLTLRVLDDEGRPVPGATAGVSWENTRATKSAERIRSVTGLTDQGGRITFDGKTFSQGISYSVTKEDYYSVWGLRYHFKDARLFRWQPWNPVLDVILKQKKNPVPMYAKRVEVKIPEFGKPIAYDLLQGDWVAPYGLGQTRDLIFEANRNVQSDREYEGTLTLRFSNESDGLAEYEIAEAEPLGLRMPYMAGEDGYVPTKTWHESRRASASGEDTVISTACNRMNYFIRVRTMLDNEGRVVSALYGKIHGDFRWFIGTRAPKSGLAFIYYLNPDGTRNIEFDPKRNLLRPTGAEGNRAAYDLGP